MTSIINDEFKLQIQDKLVKFVTDETHVSSIYKIYIETLYILDTNLTVEISSIDNKINIYISEIECMGSDLKTLINKELTGNCNCDNCETDSGSMYYIETFNKEKINEMINYALFLCQKTNNRCRQCNFFSDEINNGICRSCNSIINEPCLICSEKLSNYTSNNVFICQNHSFHPWCISVLLKQDINNLSCPSCNYIKIL